MHRLSMTCLLGLSLGWPAFALAGERLSAEELKTLYTDKTLVGIHHKRGPTKSYYGPDGRIESLSENGTQRTGKWWIDEATDTRCVRWDHKNKDFCHYVERDSNGGYVLIHSKKRKRLVEIKELLPGKQL